MDRFFPPAGRAIPGRRRITPEGTAVADDFRGGPGFRRDSLGRTARNRPCFAGDGPMEQEEPMKLVPSALAIVLVAGALVDCGHNNAGRRFTTRIDNRFFPLVPGTTFFYKGTTDGTPSSSQFIVTHEVRRIQGVDCVVVHDQVFEDGILAEDTLDFFAQDGEGNVWYFGEESKDLDENGNVVSTEGSWQAGVNGAEPGIVMKANPRVGDRYNQENAPGVAEDQAVVLSRDDALCVQFGCFDHVLTTEESTPLEPGVAEHKHYAEGVGFLSADMVQGGQEHTELVKITSGG
jgi:hypothetical protein